MEQLDKLKIKLGIPLEDTSQDELLNLYLEDAKDAILELTHLTEVPVNLLRAQVELAIISIISKVLRAKQAIVKVE